MGSAENTNLEAILSSLLVGYFLIVQGTAPSYVSELITPYAPTRQLRSSGVGLVCVPAIKRARMGGCSFRRLAAQHWNKLPCCLRMEAQESCFRKKLKTYLFPQDG